jgi:hypothetical protein
MVAQSQSRSIIAATEAESVVDEAIHASGRGRSRENHHKEPSRNDRFCNWNPVRKAMLKIAKDIEVVDAIGRAITSSDPNENGASKQRYRARPRGR